MKQFLTVLLLILTALLFLCCLTLLSYVGYKIKSLIWVVGTPGILSNHIGLVAITAIIIVIVMTAIFWIVDKPPKR